MHHLGFAERSHKEWINDVISQMKGYMMTRAFKRNAKKAQCNAFISQSDTTH